MHCVNQCLVIVDFALMPHTNNVKFWTDHNIMLHMPCSSNPWFWSTKSFYVNFIFSLNSLASNFLSNSIKIEKWFLMWGLNDIFVFNLYCCWMWWNGILLKLWWNNLDNITCNLFTWKLNFIPDLLNDLILFRFWNMIQSLIWIFVK